jgi:hypothetical protein
VNAEAWVRKRGHEPCEAMAQPADHMGIQGYVQRADGTVCDTRAWAYNSAGSLSMAHVMGEGNCAVVSTFAAFARGRVYNAQSGNWIIPAAYIRTAYTAG